MKLKKITYALFLMFTYPAIAADKGTLTIPTTAVTGNPLGVGSDQMVVPISILNGRELSLKRENTLAETLNSIPGVSNSSFGPALGRPMIRGMDSDRVKILQNGVNNLDASNLSFDHGVSIDPLIIEQIDVIRGPATLLYGGGAIGGVVNAIDHRIPKEKLQGITGRGEARYGGANLEQSNAAVVDVGTGNFVMHFDAYNRDSKNLRIPGNAISNRRESTRVWDPTQEEGEGDYGAYRTNHGRKKLLNSQSETRGGAVGASMIFDRGYAGVSYAKHQTKYGSVKEPGILLDMDTDRIDFASEIRDLGSFFERAKFKAAYTDYRHHEMDAVEIHTTFKNRGIDGTFELAHVPLLGLKGVIGTQFDSGKFDAIGHEAFIPNSKTNSQSVYVYEELPLNQHKMTFGLRHGKHEVESKGGGEIHEGESKFGDPSRKKFNTNNAAIGGLYKLNEQWSLTGNLSHNERAPSYFELFANGVHTATGVFEEGTANLKKEKSNGLDGQIRWKSGQDSLTLGAYFNKFSNFIGLLSTNSDGHADNEEVPGTEITYKKSTFSGIKAEFKGVELEGKTMLTDYVQFNVRGDYVDAKDKTHGGYVPRISPLKLGAGLKYEFDRFGARLDVLHAFKQDRVALNYNYEGTKELITDAYTNVSMMATYKLPTQLNLEAFTRANNLLDEEIREHASFLKDIAPMGGRSIMFGLRGEF
ncbi:TonB-dependent receptor [Candidatus Methylopumilus planktonicus]|uniref:TonB-dependent receptor n=1 Tax=Candidatus Methylopumilus planktonicus TaxID=1581557 RepID=UPI00112300E7|nr:TonB-dependent receptor [Candidatus Methylopumilus planktonicus]QDD06802.1 TonB-dependent receptor [Candidatus Methylopumilus planktonicus]QDD08138.1 TonB-dependent receptor [Candidatus Methylopumilus planktonicus]QDD09464.1 TonB-dependent receptor [Candidatus Methylopumilus planktonicus]